MSSSVIQRRQSFAISAKQTKTRSKITGSISNDNFPKAISKNKQAPNERRTSSRYNIRKQLSDNTNMNKNIKSLTIDLFNDKNKKDQNTGMKMPIKGNNTLKKSSNLKNYH